MKLFNYRIIDDETFSHEICKRMETSSYGIKLAYNQKRELEEIIKSLPYRHVEFIKKKKTNPLFRITAIFFLLFYLLLLIFWPIKWLATGCGYDYKSKLIQFLKKWENKLF